MTRFRIVQYIRRTFSQKRILEIVALLTFLVIVAVVVTVITPYKPETGQSLLFYAEDEQSHIQDEAYMRARVDAKTATTLTVTIQDGPLKGGIRTVEDMSVAATKYIDMGDTVIVFQGADVSNMLLYDSFRLPGLLVLMALFIGAVVLIGRRKGFMSIIGLGVSVVIIGWCIIPLLMAGYNALLVCIVGAYMIALFSIYIAHGFSRRTTIAVCCIGIILSLVVLLALIAVYGLSLSGLTDETAFYFSAEHTDIDMRGILVGGIVIATLGVLDDIVTAQVAVVDELHHANRDLSARSLYRRASSVGGEHIASLVNTLALAYAGASLPIVLALSQQHGGNSTLLMFNSEFIVTEVARTLVASLGLVLAVPISTLAAVIVYKRLLK